MNQQELERMMELIDDRYVQEAVPSEVYEQMIEVSYDRSWKGLFKRHRKGLSVAACAVIIITAGVIYTVSRQHMFTYLDLDRPVTETDYGQFFWSDSYQGASAEYTLEVVDDGITYNYEDPELIPAMPFDTSGFSKVSARLYCHSDSTPENLYLIYQKKNREKNKSLRIEVTSSGEIYSCYDFDGWSRAPRRNGVPIYGYDEIIITDNGYLQITQLCFVADGIGYSIHGVGLSIEEMGKIMDGILEQGIDIHAFDTRKGIIRTEEHEELTLKELDQLETFAGRIPQDMYIGSLVLYHQVGFYDMAYENGVLASENVFLEYGNSSADYLALRFYNKGGYYDRYGEVDVTLEELTPELLSQMSEEDDTADDSNDYCFEIDCGNIIVHIEGACQQQDLWEMMKLIKGQ